MGGGSFFAEIGKEPRADEESPWIRRRGVFHPFYFEKRLGNDDPTPLSLREFHQT